MCKLKSGIILKDRIFIPDYDSHTDMLDELGIKDTKANAERLFIRAELSPENGDVFSSIDSWKFKVDQDIVPDWYVEEVDKERFINAVKVWAKDRIHIGVDGLKISTGENHYIKDCKDVTICGNATVSYICDNATVSNICGNATVSDIRGNATVSDIYGNATVSNICGNATVSNIYGNATVSYIRGNATVSYIYDNATVSYIRGNATVSYIYGNATVSYIRGNATVEKASGRCTLIGSPYGWSNKGTVILCENATFKDPQTKTIWQSGEWELKKVEGKICC